MVYVDARACFVVDALCNAAGLIAALYAWEVIFSRNPRQRRRLLYLVPILLLSAWLESAFNGEVARQALNESARLSALYRRMATDVIGWPLLALAFVLIRRQVMARRRPTTVPFPSGATIEVREEGVQETGLQHAVERFLVAGDKADVAAVVAAYAPEFTCVRVAEEGGFAHLTREQMVSFWDRAIGNSGGASGGHALPTRETTIHFAEAIGDLGWVLLTRVKNLGNGWEPMFYVLVWKRQDGDWRLLREFVHQKSIPRWR
jgi:hypothetical protein